MKDRLERGTGYFVSLSEVVASMAADGDNYRDAATVLYRLLRNEHSRAPEWIVDGLEGLWSPEDEDLSDAWETLEKAAKSGRLRGRKVMNYGFFGGEIIPFLAKHGVDISPSIPTPTPEQEVHQTAVRAGRTPPTPSELLGQDGDAAANPGLDEAKTIKANREAHDITRERGCRRRILEQWDTIELAHGPKAAGRQVLRILERQRDQSDKTLGLKNVQNTLCKLRKEKLIP